MTRLRYLNLYTDPAYLADRRHCSKKKSLMEGKKETQGGKKEKSTVEVEKEKWR